MKLLTKAIEAKLPALYANDGKPASEVRVFVKFFDPTGEFTWYGTEYNPESREFFGYVNGFEGELGYFSLDELESCKDGIRGIRSLPIERDLDWDDTKTLADVMR